MANQDNIGYAEREQGFEAIPIKLKMTGLPSLDEHIRDMFFMACYDLDRFRGFVLQSSFPDLFQVSADVAGEIKRDDQALLRFGISWLGSGFDLRKSIQVRDEVVGG